MDIYLFVCFLLVFFAITILVLLRIKTEENNSEIDVLSADDFEIID